MSHLRGRPCSTTALLQRDSATLLAYKRGSPSTRSTAPTPEVAVDGSRVDAHPELCSTSSCWGESGIRIYLPHGFASGQRRARHGKRNDRAITAPLWLGLPAGVAARRTTTAVTSGGFTNTFAVPLASATTTSATEVSAAEGATISSSSTTTLLGRQDLPCTPGPGKRPRASPDVARDVAGSTELLGPTVEHLVKDFYTKSTGANVLSKRAFALELTDKVSRRLCGGAPIIPTVSAPLTISSF